MSLHKSLRIDKFKNKQRSVRKRWERVKYLVDNSGGKIPPSIFGLPKEKVIRIKPIKKEKKQIETNLTNLINTGGK